MDNLVCEVALWLLLVSHTFFGWTRKISGLDGKMLRLRTTVLSRFCSVKRFQLTCVVTIDIDRHDELGIQCNQE